MEHWQLIDTIESADAPEEFPRVAIQSVEQLRAELGRLRQREPSVIGLQGPDQEGLQIGFGGPLAGIRYYVQGNAERVILADRPYSEKRVDFKSEGDFLAFWPDELVPVDQASEIVTHFYRTRSFPEWANWKEWDRLSKTWKMRRAVAVTPATNGLPEQPVMPKTERAV